MERKDIKLSNISEYIYQKRKELFDKSEKMVPFQRFYWNSKEWKILEEWVATVTSCILEEGMYVLGASHWKVKI